ncbi:MAG: hemerythrin domain-containing protein [Desulfobacteraceae bacterium]|nr:MAG: hemerythrin domain-containing protein [Desulfobacteraceae bacterium]
MDIIKALIDHHAVLRQLYSQSEGDPGVFDEFVRHLVVHHTMEEKYFYDLLEQIPEARHDSLEAVNEHHIIELILKDSEDFPRDHERFPIKIEGVGEYTNHHLDEEETGVFLLAQKVFSAEDLNAMGALFTEAKDMLLGIALPEPPKAMAGKGSEKSKKGGGSAEPPAAKSTSQGLGIGSLRE